MNNNSTVRWIAIITTIFLFIVSASFAYINRRVDKHDELIIKSIECQARVEVQLKYMNQKIDELMKKIE